MDDHILFIWPIFIFMLSSTLPFALMTFSRYMNLSTVSFVLPSTLNSSLVLLPTFCWMIMSLVLSWLILSPTFAAAFSKLVVIICKSSTESADNAISSAKSSFASLFSSFHLMALFTMSTDLLIKKSITSKKSSVKSLKPCLTPVLIRKKIDIPVSVLMQHHLFWNTIDFNYFPQ